MTADQIDAEVLAAHARVRELEQELDQAADRRALVFALATEHGRTSGDIARTIGPGVHPGQVISALRRGRPLLNARRRRLEQTA